MTEKSFDYQRENKSYWTGRAAGYSAVNQEELSGGQKLVWGRTLDAQIRAHFPGRDREGIRILDVGTGPGFFAILLAEAGYDVTAVDYTEAMLQEAAENAGALRSRIDFRRMDAQQLSFPSHSFDVVLSRNLTWNLPEPAEAYAEWSRVLRPGGLLLNFDANWYRYLYDETAQEGHARDRENVASAQAQDDTAGTDVLAMEAIARRAPLSATHRPAWDLEILKGLGLFARADEEIWRRVWTENERINNASTPMFLVQAAKYA